jgi:hypothetical protein
MFTVTLRCGEELSYEARSFLPRVGDLVPCRHHGYCTVEMAGGHVSTGSSGPSVHRARPRSQRELQEWLRQRPVTTVQALRRHRFTLRMIAVAERDGLVDVDLGTGRVAIRLHRQPLHLADEDHSLTRAAGHGGLDHIRKEGHASTKR